MLKNAIVAAALLGSGFAANALIGGVTPNPASATFINLSAPGVVTGGALYPDSTSQAIVGSTVVAAIPFNASSPLIQTEGAWLAAGPGNNGDATVNLGGVDYVSFLWGSPDDYNSLTVTTNLISKTYDYTDFLGIVIGGNQSFASYLGFEADLPGESILSITFSSPNTNAFEASNFSTTSPIPEPETYALMLAGLGVVGFMARRRKAD